MNEWTFLKNISVRLETGVFASYKNTLIGAIFDR
jgi:hypothetical protein